MTATGTEEETLGGTVLDITPENLETITSDIVLTGKEGKSLIVNRAIEYYKENFESAPASEATQAILSRLPEEEQTAIDEAVANSFASYDDVVMEFIMGGRQAQVSRQKASQRMKDNWAALSDDEKKNRVAAAQKAKK